MNNPEDFILTTDFATLKNDSQLTRLSFNINNGDTVPAATGGGATPGVRIYQQTVTVGTRGAPLRSRMRNTTLSSTWYGCSQLIFPILISYPGTPNYELDVGAILERINPTQMRVYAAIPNGNPQAAMTIRRTERIECDFTTFLSPFN